MITKKWTILCSCILFVCCASTQEKKESQKEEQMVICTMEFRSIAVQIKSVDHLFDEFYLLNNQTWEKKKIIASRRDPKSDTANYALIDDSMQKSLQNKEVPYTLIAVKSGVRVIEEPYIFSADACHVFKVSGKEMIITH